MRYRRVINSPVLLDQDGGPESQTGSPDAINLIGMDLDPEIVVSDVLNELAEAFLPVVLGHPTPFNFKSPMIIYD